MCWKNLKLWYYQLFCKHNWRYTTINYYDKNGKQCVDLRCKKCGKTKTIFIK